MLNAFRELVAQNFGDFGLGQALASLQGRPLMQKQFAFASSQQVKTGFRFAVKYYNPFTGVCIIRCSRDQAREVGADVAGHGFPEFSMVMHSTPKV